MRLRNVAVVLAALLILVACGGETAPPDTAGATPEPTAQPVVAVVETVAPSLEPPTATAAATSTPTATPSLQPSATPSPTTGLTATPAQIIAATATITPTTPATTAPDARIGEGRWLHRIGDCAGARRTLADLLADEPMPGVASEARYLLAQCYLRDEAPAEAATALAQLLKDAPEEDPFRGPAQFLMGEAQSRLGLWKDAEAAYTAFAPTAPEVGSLTWLRIGRARRELGNLPDATSAYSEALRLSSDWTHTVAARRALADLALARGDVAAAVAQYDVLRGNATDTAWAAEMETLAGLALAAGGNAAEAEQRWQAAVDADLTTSHAHRAMAELVDAGATVDEYERGVVNYYNGVYELALAAFERLRAEDPTGRQGAAWYYEALSKLAMGQTDAGLTELNSFVASYPGSPFWADAWMTIGRTQARRDYDDAAIAAYRELAKQRPDAPQAVRALTQATLLESGLGRQEPAALAYLDIARRYPSTDDAWRAYQSAGLIYYRLGEYRKAGEVWSEMAASTTLEAFTKPVANFWLGRAQAAAGETAAAGESWRKAAAASPESFYGLRAAERLAQQTGVRPTPAPIPPVAGADVERNELATWLRTWGGEGTLELPASVTDDADWKRGQTLVTLGLRPEGLAAWGRVQKRAEKNPWALTALALAFRDAGAYRLSLLSAEQVVGLWGQGGMRDAPVSLQRLAYPYAFKELVRTEAERWNLDPRLLLAVIRQESRFETGATSVAGARGLMQVMPGTAQGIADRLGWTDFDPAHAYWPYINVALGANYVAEWLKHFDGSVFTALAAYNGGPGNAAVWRKWAPDDEDLFQALININETRVYVQSVWAQYDAYKRLYER